MRQLIINRLSPFKHRAFRQFFFAQSLSLVGSSSHELARAWIVVEMLGKASALGTLMLALALPCFFLILSGGSLVDRIDARRLMVVTKTVLAISAFALFFIGEFSHIQLWHLILFALIEGVVMAFDSPAYQTLTVRMVPREDFQLAIAMNSTNYHTSRMLGPVIAGLLMAWKGPELVFLFDGISFLSLIFIIRNLELRNVRKPKTGLANHSVREGFEYILNNPALKFIILQLFLTICLIHPILNVVFRTFVKIKFNLTPEAFGYVFSFAPMGSLLGALSFIIFKPQNPLKALRYGIPGAAITMTLVPFSESLWLTVILMAMAGFFTYLSFASLTVSLHLNVLEDFRGRVGALIGMAFNSVGPLMGLPVGYFADHHGFNFSVVILSVSFFMVSALIAFSYFKTSKNSTLATP